MKITGPDRTGSPAALAGTKRTAAPGFSLGGTEEAVETSHAGASLGVSGVDALIALQEVDGPLERRRRAVRRAGRILDVLDEMKLALLGDGLPAAALQRLSAAVREERETIEDPRLHEVLEEIETRARVEMAKLESRRAA